MGKQRYHKAKTKSNLNEPNEPFGYNGYYYRGHKLEAKRYDTFANKGIF